MEERSTGLRECPKCSRTLALESFGAASHRPGGLASACRECSRRAKRGSRMRLRQQRANLLDELAAQRRARIAAVVTLACCGAEEIRPGIFVHEPSCFAVSLPVRTPRRMAAARNGLA